MATTNLQTATSGATSSVYGSIRSAFLESTGLTTAQEDITCFRLNPPSEDVDVYVRKVGSTKKGMRLKPNSAGIIDLDSLDDENYDIEAYSTSTTPPLLLHKFIIKKTDEFIDIHAVDLKATALVTRFSKSDVPLGGAAVLGKFKDRNGKTCDLSGKTDSNGSITLVLPEGIIENLTAQKGEIKIEKQGKIVVPPPDPTPGNIPRKAKCIMIDIDSKSFSSVVQPIQSDARVVILGDVSGSMRCGTQMDILRRAFQEILDKCRQHGWSVSLASWNTAIQWCPATSWIQPNQTDIVKSWIQGRLAGGGNNMKVAIDECMKRFPTATDVYVMCDGDVSPFSVNQGGTNWSIYRAQYPTTKFHFIALGKGASFEAMEAMAHVGGGIFSERA